MFCLGLNLLNGVLGLQNVLFADLAKGFGADYGQIDRRHQRAQRLIGANIGRGFLPPNVLFAGGKREDEPAPARMVHAHSYQASRHLPDKSFTGREEAQVWTAKAHRDTERLRLAGHNVSHSGFQRVFARRFENSQRHGLRYVHDRQSSEFVRKLGNVVGLLDGPEKIRRLDDDRGVVGADRTCQFLQIDAAIRSVIDQLDVNPEVLGICVDDSAVLRMDCLCDEKPILLVDAVSHENGFGQTCAPVI